MNIDIKRIDQKLKDEKKDLRKYFEKIYSEGKSIDDLVQDVYEHDQELFEILKKGA